MRGVTLYTCHGVYHSSQKVCKISTDFLRIFLEKKMILVKDARDFYRGRAAKI